MIIHMSTSFCKYSSVQLIVYAYSIIPKNNLTIIDILYSTSYILYILYIELWFKGMWKFQAIDFSMILGQNPKNGVKFFYFIFGFLRSPPIYWYVPTPNLPVTFRSRGDSRVKPPPPVRKIALKSKTKPQIKKSTRVKPVQNLP